MGDRSAVALLRPYAGLPEAEQYSSTAAMLVSPGSGVRERAAAEQSSRAGGKSGAVNRNEGLHSRLRSQPAQMMASLPCSRCIPGCGASRTDWCGIRKGTPGA